MCFFQGHLWALQQRQGKQLGLPVPAGSSCLPFPGALSLSRACPCSWALLPPSTSLEHAELAGSSH